MFVRACVCVCVLRLPLVVPSRPLAWEAGKWLRPVFGGRRRLDDGRAGDACVHGEGGKKAEARVGPPPPTCLGVAACVGGGKAGRAFQAGFPLCLILVAATRERVRIGLVPWVILRLLLRIA